MKKHAGSVWGACNTSVTYPLRNSLSIAIALRIIAKYNMKHRAALEGNSNFVSRVIGLFAMATREMPGCHVGGWSCRHLLS